MTIMSSTIDECLEFEPGRIPSDAAMIMSALEAGSYGMRDRRLARRYPYRVATEFRLFNDEIDIPRRLLYTRDINRRGVGFITRDRLPLGYGGIIDLPGADGKLSGLHCTLLRCREATVGWFEGSIYFNREQPQFDR